VTNPTQGVPINHKSKYSPLAIEDTLVLNTAHQTAVHT